MGREATIGDVEMMILRYVTDHAPITVREVAEHCATTTGQARTTVLTVMDRLRRKGFLTRTKQNGVYRYAAKSSKAELLQGMVRDFVKHSLGGKMSPFVAYLADEDRVSEEELAELKQLVLQLEKKRRR